MQKTVNSLYNIRLLDEQAKKDTIIHRLHPLIKLLTTVVYLTTVVSFNRYEISGLLPFALYPIIIFVLAELPFIPILKRLLFVLPFVIGIGILNPVFDNKIVLIGTLELSSGWITFLSIIIKSFLTVSVSIMLIATTGIDRLAAALRMLRIPKIFVLQLQLTYRYISVLISELLRMQRAYSLRAPDQKGLHISSWGPFAGGLILRSFDRAGRVYRSMNLRGFTGEYNTGSVSKVKSKDITYFICFTAFFIIARFYNIPQQLGSLLEGVF